MQDGQRNAEQLASLTSWNTEQWKGQEASQKQHLEQQKDIPTPRCLSQSMGYIASEKSQNLFTASYFTWRKWL